MLKVRGGGGVKVVTRGRYGYAFVGKGAMFIPFGGRCSLMPFFKGQERVDGESAAKKVVAG